MVKVPRTRSVSYKTPPQGRTTGHQAGRSFSDRARDLPPSNVNYTTRNPYAQMPLGLSEESTTPRGLPKDAYIPHPGMAAQENEEPPAAPAAPSQPSPSTRLSEPQGGWASDRSPLQKLEVTLNGISKEEKRARVQEAEMRLRERLARQKVDRERTGTSAPASRAEPAQSTQHGSRAAVGVTGRGERRGMAAGDMAGDAPAMPPQRQPGSTAVRHNRAASMNPNYPAVRRPEDPQYARAGPALATTERRSVARASVSPGGPATSRTISQSGPARQVHAAPKPSEEKTVESQPARQAMSGSVDSQSKPKKQTVSFNVPPPTPPPIFEWRNAPTARLGAADFDFQHLDIDRSKAWWEGGGTTNRRKSRALPKNYQTPAQKLTGEKDPVLALLLEARANG